MQAREAADSGHLAVVTEERRRTGGDCCVLLCMGGRGGGGNSRSDGQACVVDMVPICSNESGRYA